MKTSGQVAFGLHPLVLPARNPRYSLTVDNNARAGRYGLKIALVWWVLGVILAAGCFTFVYRSFAGKVGVDKDSRGYSDQRLSCTLPPGGVTFAPRTTRGSFLRAAQTAKYRVRNTGTPVALTCRNSARYFAKQGARVSADIGPQTTSGPA